MLVDRQMLAIHLDHIDAEFGFPARHYRMGKDIKRGGSDRGQIAIVERRIGEVVEEIRLLLRQPARTRQKAALDIITGVEHVRVPECPYRRNGRPLFQRQT